MSPALNIYLSSVLFTSAAKNGKLDGGLRPIPAYSGNEWKLTLLDSSRSEFNVTTTAVSSPTFGGKVSIDYSGAKTGETEYISAMLLDDDGNPLYYGRSTAALTQADGTAELTVPALTKGTYTLMVFSEQYNGDYKTDYASNFKDVTLTVTIGKDYTVQFDTAGGTAVADKTNVKWTDKVLDGITAPTRSGYKFNGWKYGDKTVTADTTYAELASDNTVASITLTAQWTVNRYTITFDTAGGSKIDSITQDYGTEIAAAANPTREGYTFTGWDKEIPKTMPAENITITAQWKDSEKPTGEIKINENSWKTFLNSITFDLFFKDTQTVIITAADNSGEAVTVEYLLSDKELTKTELDGMTFTAYTAPFGIDPDNEYIIYVKLTDTAGNTDYICSDGIVLDATSPVISGIENGKTYCEAQTVTIDEKYIDTVAINGTAVTLDENNSFVLSPADGEQNIIVKDKAGNSAEMTVTVNDGHTDDDNDHKCDCCGKTLSECTDDDEDDACKVIKEYLNDIKDCLCIILRTILRLVELLLALSRTICSIIFN